MRCAHVLRFVITLLIVTAAARDSGAPSSPNSSSVREARAHGNDEPRPRGESKAQEKGLGLRTWLLVALAVAALAVIAFFALGGDVSTDTEGRFDVDVQTPQVDVDVEPPQVDVEAPDIDVDPGDVDVEQGDAEADATTGD